MNLDQSQVFLSNLLQLSLHKQQEHFYLLLFLKNYAHLIILAYFSLITSSKQLLQIPIDI
jgi:hypothetical protein